VRSRKAMPALERGLERIVALILGVLFRFIVAPTRTRSRIVAVMRLRFVIVAPPV